MIAPWHTLLKPLALGLGLALAMLALVWNGAPPAAHAAGPTCTVCLDGGCDYAAIQAAVDDAGCMEIKVAEGIYTGVQARPAPARYPSPPESGLITQVVYINRTVAVRGGYTTTNWTTPYPLTQPTTLDAGRLGRVLVVAGAVGAASARDISPTIEGLGLTNGDAAGLGGDGWEVGDGGGGGVYVTSATATISACRVFSNTADAGGGLYLQSSPVTLISNSVTANTAAHAGGGLYLDHSAATLNANSVTANTASYYGGGLYLLVSPATLRANSVATNTANYGGGLFLESSAATLVSNNVAANTAAYEGGGLYLLVSPATLSANSVTANTASSYGGGLCMYASGATLTNNVVADNRAGTRGSGLYISDGMYVPAPAPWLLHTTIARNGGGDGSGLYVNILGTVWLTNTILVSQTVGIVVNAGTAAMSGTLWYGNAADRGGAVGINHSGDTTGRPAFVDPDGGDYHIRLGSRAIDRGVDAGVTTDKDGHPRDAHPDLGAYEFEGPIIYTYLPVVVKVVR